MTRLVFGLVAGIVGWTGLAARIEAQLAGIDVDLTQVADSGSYSVYSYSLGNPATSTWGLLIVRLDIGATSGTPATLPATGVLLDATSSPRTRPHAEVGPITPAGWEAGLSVDATLGWYPPFDGITSEDSIAPGETRTGYGIRSSYLPGIHAVTAEPTVESCCQEPLPDGDFYPPPSSFSVTSAAVVPRYTPSEVTIGLLREQAEGVCTDPVWIHDAALCEALAGSLDAASSRLAADDLSGARASLGSVLDILESGREPGGPIEDNAYWLLKLNTEHVIGMIPRMTGPA